MGEVKKVTAAVIERDGRILIARRRRGSHLEGKWEFPGGKVEEGETPEQCLRRELREEFGVEAEVGEFICASPYDYGHISIELLAYRVTRVEGDFYLNSHAEIRWVGREELPAYDFADADRPIVAHLLEYH
jgi:8-oxo-dGTP diphosphatase